MRALVWTGSRAAQDSERKRPRFGKGHWDSVKGTPEPLLAAVADALAARAIADVTAHHLPLAIAGARREDL
jgi:hypothetical protein